MRGIVAGVVGLVAGALVGTAIGALVASATGPNTATVAAVARSFVPDEATVVDVVASTSGWPPTAVIEARVVVESVAPIDIGRAASDGGWSLHAQDTFRRGGIQITVDRPRPGEAGDRTILTARRDVETMLWRTVTGALLGAMAGALLGLATVLARRHPD